MERMKRTQQNTMKSYLTVGLQIRNAWSYMDRTVEMYTYDLSNFLADIGGSLGLLLGLSVLSILQMVDNFFAYCWKVFKIFIRKRRSQVTKLRKRCESYFH